MKKSGHIVYISIVLIISAFTVIVMLGAESPGSISFDPKDGSIKMNIDKKMSFSEILEQMIHDDDIRKRALAIMRDYSIYSTDDFYLYHKLSSLEKNSKEMKYMVSLIKNNKDLWLAHNFYEINEEVDGKKLVRAIENLSYDSDISQRIRMLQKKSRGPWRDALRPVKVYIERRGEDGEFDHGIKRGQAVIYCSNGFDFISNSFAVYKSNDVIGLNPILVKIIKSDRPCLGGFNDLSIKIHENDALKLYSHHIEKDINIAYFHEMKDVELPCIPEENAVASK